MAELGPKRSNMDTCFLHSKTSMCIALTCFEHGACLDAYVSRPFGFPPFLGMIAMRESAGPSYDFPHRIDVRIPKAGYFGVCLVFLECSYGHLQG